MILYQYFSLLVISLISSILDTSFFSFFEIYRSPFLITFALLISFSLMGKKREAVYFGGVSAIFYSAFSSVPVFFLISVFVLLPFIISYFRDKTFSESSNLLCLIVFLLSGLFFRVLLSLFLRDFSTEALISYAVFPILNGSLGFLLFLIIKYFRLRFEGSRRAGGI